VSDVRLPYTHRQDSKIFVQAEVDTTEGGHERCSFLLDTGAAYSVLFFLAADDVRPGEVGEPYSTVIRGRTFVGHLISVTLRFSSNSENIELTAPAFMPDDLDTEIPNLLGMSHLGQLNRFCVHPSQHFVLLED
jgi:hypothetical protein